MAIYHVNVTVQGPNGKETDGEHIFEADGLSHLRSLIKNIYGDAKRISFSAGTISLSTAVSIINGWTERGN